MILEKREEFSDVRALSTPVSWGTGRYGRFPTTNSSRGSLRGTKKRAEHISLEFSALRRALRGKRKLFP